MHFSNRLTKWYKKNQRDFPWRNTKNPYFIWLSEIILQQTKTTQGLPYYMSFVKHYPTIFDLAKADEAQVLKLWQGLGYYTRARNLHFTAKYIVRNFNGDFPNNYKELLKLKGIGDYTASAIASICYNEKTAVVDGNVYRLLARYFEINTPTNSSKGIKYFKLFAQELLPKNNIGLYNQAIMDFGATICTPKKPKCDVCVFNDSCLGFKNKVVNILPIKTKKAKIKKRYFNYLVIIDKTDKTILHKRTKKDIWLNLHEFPLLESSTELSKNELINHKLLQQTITKSKITNINLFNKKVIIHKLSHQHIYTKFWIINIYAHIDKSILFSEINDFPISTLIHNFIKEFEN